MTRRRLLFISPRFLFPLDQGGKIRTVGVLRALKDGAFNIVLASPAPADAAAYAGDIATVSDRFISWPERRTSKLRRLMAVAGPFPVSVVGDRSSAGRAVIQAALAEKPDVMVVDFPHAAVLLPPRWDVASVIFTHNVECEIFERHAEVATGLWKPVWRREAAKMRRFEGGVLRRFDSVIAVSERDGRHLAHRFGLRHVARIDTGVDLDFYKFHSAASRPDPDDLSGTIVFSGAMDSQSNIEGINFLMDEVWPLVAAARPQARAIVVGRNPPQAMVAKARSRNLAWQFTGFVDDTRPHVLEADLAVIPLRVGSGTRLKAFEAMGLGRPVVSTGLGVEGLALEAGTHYLLAESPSEFADSILRLLSDRALRIRLATAARTLLEERFSWREVGRQFEKICLKAAEARP